MLAKGLAATDELDSPEYATMVWTMADDAVLAGAAQQDVDFPHATIDELGLQIATTCGRSSVTETRRSGQKRRHGESATAADEAPAANDAPT